MSLKRVLGFFVLAFAVYYLITYPVESGNIVKEAGEFLARTFERLSIAVKEL